MAMRYSRSALLSMRNWWKKQPRNIKPMLPTDWNDCKAAGILKHSRGKRGGACNRLTNSIQVLGSRGRQTNIPVANSTRNQVTANHWNLLNIQIDTSIQDLNAANTSSSWRPHFVPSILLSNAMSLAPKIDEIAYTLQRNMAERDCPGRSNQNQRIPVIKTGPKKRLTAGFVCMAKTPSSARYCPIFTVSITKYYG